MYYKFKDSYIFDENGLKCYEHNGKIIADNKQRGDGTVRTIMIDMFSGEINQVTIKYEDTYLSTVSIDKNLGDVRELVEVSADDALRTLQENKPTLTLLRHRLNMQSIPE